MADILTIPLWSAALFVFKAFCYILKRVRMASRPEPGIIIHSLTGAPQSLLMNTPPWMSPGVGIHVLLIVI